MRLQDQKTKEDTTDYTLDLNADIGSKQKTRKKSFYPLF